MTTEPTLEPTFTFDSLDNLEYQKSRVRENKSNFDDLSRWASNGRGCGYTPDQIQCWLRNGINDLYTAQQEIDRIKNAPPPRPLPLTHIIETLLARPEVCDVQIYDGKFIVSFIPVLLDNIATGLQHVALAPTGYLHGTDATYHPHIIEGDACLGNANYAAQLAIRNQDLLGLFAVISQMRIQHNPDSELDKYWRNDSWEWWERHYKSRTPEDHGWDGHSVQDAETGQVLYVEQYYGKPLAEILVMWNRYRSRDEDEDDCYAHCERCGECISEDSDYERCKDCGDTLCDDDCLNRHMERGHNSYPCAGRNNNWEHEEGPVFVDTTCTLCDQYICEECMPDHDDKYHQEEEEDEVEDDTPTHEEEVKALDTRPCEIQGCTLDWNHGLPPQP